MSDQTKSPTRSEDHKAHPGDPERDHTVPPDQLDPSESVLPEGAQPTQRVTRISSAIFVIALTAALAAVLSAALVANRWESFLAGAVVGAVLIAAGALPVLIAYRLRIKDQQDLNRREQSGR
ncbi:MAG: hypothetical protein EA376_10905 [Phycisphaeraceae bacterium]|nr:MAG: hypothetical protein EA376_10905 [Phycisphaeraceae bacterium]